MNVAIPWASRIILTRPTIRRLQTLALLVIYVRNWTEVYQKRGSLPGAPLHFRNGTMLKGSTGDDPLGCFLTVFRDRWYSRYNTEYNGGVYIDLGANIGMVSIDWTSRLSDVTVQAYEPDPQTFASLRQNIICNQLQGRVKVYNEAVGRAVGTTEMVRGDRSVATSSVLDLGGSGRENFTSPTVGLDGVAERCGSDGRITFVKINTEGAEAEILEGAADETLERISQFAIQYHTLYLLRRCTARLEAAGFSCTTLPVSLETGLLYARRLPL